MHSAAMAKVGQSALVRKDRIGETDRTFVVSPVSLKVGQGRVNGVACDVSENGIKIVLDQPPQLGPVSVKLIGLPSVAGEVCWRRSDSIGVQLGTPLSPEVLDTSIKHHGGGD
jgi:PilZ domain-containing protein